MRPIRGRSTLQPTARKRLHTRRSAHTFWPQRGERGGLVTQLCLVNLFQVARSNYNVIGLEHFPLPGLVVHFELHVRIRVHAVGAPVSPLGARVCNFGIETVRSGAAAHV